MKHCCLRYQKALFKSRTIKRIYGLICACFAERAMHFFLTRV